MTSQQSTLMYASGNTVVRTVAFVGTILFVYFGSYVTLMDTRDPAKDDDGQVLYYSSYRWGTVYSIRRGDSSKFLFHGPTIWNSIFYPADCIFGHYGLPVSK